MKYHKELASNPLHHLLNSRDCGRVNTRGSVLIVPSADWFGLGLLSSVCEYVKPGMAGRQYEYACMISSSGSLRVKRTLIVQ